MNTIQNRWNNEVYYIVLKRGTHHNQHIHKISCWKGSVLHCIHKQMIKHYHKTGLTAISMPTCIAPHLLHILKKTCLWHFHKVDVQIFKGFMSSQPRRVISGRNKRIPTASKILIHYLKHIPPLKIWRHLERAETR